MKTLRLLPIVVMATSALLVLKVTGLVTGGGYALTGVSELAAQEGEAVSEADLAAADLAARALFEAVPAPGGEGPHDTLLEDDTEAIILERLASRRAELDALSQELDLRLAVVEAAELRIEERMAELAALEARINAAMDAQETREAEQFAGLVAMYEAMRPADAASIFNDLDMTVLLRVSRSMNPRKLGPIMAKMVPEKAQALTVRMASADESAPIAVSSDGFDHLPQIVGE